jgi:hypothetical protein
MFFLATVDEQNRPTVSYKGGAPGFVRITGSSELVFPVFDGNGMFLSLGNIVGTANIGMLFIDFESPRRLRVQGTAEILPKDALSDHSPGARYLIRVTVSQLFVNCGRYIHTIQSRTLSPHVPDESGRQPFPAWKRIDVIADSLNESDRRKVVAAGGPIPLEAYRGERATDKSTTVD